MAESLAEFFLTNFQAHHDEHAYGQRRGYRMEWFTYGQVLEMALQFCRELQTRGIGKGERVMLWSENCAEWVAAFFGCAMCGVVVVPMDDGAEGDFAARVARQVEAKLWVCSRRHAAENITGAVPVIDLEEIKVPALPQRTRLGRGTLGLSVGRDDTLQIVFTSGTTAEPKGVVITHGNVLANIAPLEREMLGYLKYERWVHPVRFLNLLPLSHVFGQFLGMFLPPLLGGTVIFQEELKPSEIVSTIRRERVSVLVSVPRVLQSLKQKIERDLEDGADGRKKIEGFRRRLRMSEGKHFLLRWWIFRDIHRQFGWKFWAFISGGAALGAETEEFWGRLGYAAIQGYGLTETTSLISVNHPFKLGRGSIGKVLPGREVKLAEDGEILIRGGGVAAGYWGAKHSERPADEVTAAGEVTDKDGWYRTGDVGALDEAGNLYFKGRKKEVIVTPAGLNIYPEDLEAALRRQPEVRDCVVVGIERGGNAEPCAVMILRDDARAQEVVERANQGLAEFQRMRMWVRWPQEDFPRTSTQKPRRNVIAGFAAREILQPGEKDVASDSPVMELIGRITGRKGKNASSWRDSDLSSDLGLSSLDRVELISALEDRYQVDLSETRFSAARTVGDVERMLSGEARPRAEYHYPDWVLRWPVTWVRWLAQHLLMMPAVMVLGWPWIEGRENLRGVNGPLLVVCNHIDDVDVGFVQTALPARLRNRIATAAGGEALQKLHSPGVDRNFFGRIYDRMQWALGVSLLNLFPLPREAGFRKSFAYAGRAVDRGYSVLVFPEGRHTVDGKMNAFRAGIGLLAKNLDIPVLPMRIVGLFEIKQAGRKFARPWKIGVRIGRPMRFTSESDPAEIAQKLQSAVEGL
ncbi:MAG: AMP-binding protein [Candidatus Sulfotelmatobacter sp.]|jgi:long-chain acyl-CoA synthetase